MTDHLTVRIMGACTLDSPLTHYVIVRSDLPVGLKVAEAIHAAGESVPKCVPSGTHAVALETDDLVSVASGLLERKISHVRIVENDPPFSDELVAIGLEPLRDRSIVKEVIGKLRLVQ